MSTTLPLTLDDVHAAYATYLQLDDPLTITIPLAARIAHEWEDAEAIALAIIGASSSAKTELVVPFGLAAKGYALSSLTPQTLLSGWRTAAGNQSLLLRLIDHVLAIKDLTSILSGRPDERAKVLGQLREILDGAYDQTWGTGDRVAWQGKVSVITACTPVIDQHHDAIAQLGTRWLYLRTSVSDPEAQARAALSRGGASKGARAQAVQVVVDYVDQYGAMPLAAIPLDDDHQAAIASWATLLAATRTPVVRDRYRRDIIEVPVPEGPARAAKQLHMIAAAYARMCARQTVTDADIKIIERLVWDSMPHLRARVLRIIVDRPGIGASQIAAAISARMTTTIGRVVEDLAVLGVIEKAAGGWRLSGEHHLPSPPPASSRGCAPARSSGPPARSDGYGAESDQISDLSVDPRRYPSSSVVREVLCGACGTLVDRVAASVDDTGLVECDDCGATS